MPVMIRPTLRHLEVPPKPMKHFKRLLLAILIVFILPTLVSAGLWVTREHPENWRDARWSSSGLLKAAADDEEAAIYVFSARTGGLKGSVASHAWIVLKPSGGADYVRYDKVGWGSPIRRNHRPADAFWYSNQPQIVASVTGAAAEQLIPRVEQAISDYPHSAAGDYQIYPGPNSNTFVAHVLRQVPELDAVLPPDAVGRDYLSDGKLLAIDSDNRDMHLTYQGLFGFAAGARSGFEVHFMGLVAGLDFRRPAIKLPGIGTIGF